MIIFDRSLPSPAANLACDEALLDLCENSELPGFLRFWESPCHFVVLGYGKRLAEEVDEAACVSLQIPILRRASGGGTVLQGPGCLNYSIILPIDSDTESISCTNCFVMKRVRSAIAPLSRGAVEVQGFTDLTLDGLKFSGNAQRRKKRCFLFHGAFLLDFDLRLIERTLKVPSQQPEYRRGRTHRDFLVNLGATGSAIKMSMAETWGAANRPAAELVAEIEQHTELLAEKYSSDEWNRRF